MKKKPIYIFSALFILLSGFSIYNIGKSSLKVSGDEAKELLHKYESLKELRPNVYTPECYDPEHQAGDMINLFDNIFTEEAAKFTGTEISLEEEEEIGDELHEALSEEFKIIDYDSRRNTLIKILNSLLPYIERDIEYEIHLIDDENINAFAIAGGHIYVTTELYEYVDSWDELAVIIGHEIGHVDKKHCVLKMQKFKTMKTLFAEPGAIAANIGILLSTPFGQLDELESDRFGAYSANKAGFDPRKGKDFFIKLKDLEGEPSYPDALFRSHPYSEMRERCLEEYISNELGK